jgi:hypothetical protein
MDKKDKERLEKERLRRYGQLVCDFANARTTEDACISLLNDAQKVFDFSKDFPEQALQNLQVSYTIYKDMKLPD